MLTADEIVDKLFLSAKEFETAYWQKDYAKAKYIYDTAERVALFAEVGLETRRKLFLAQNEDDDDGPRIWGAYNQDRVRDAYWQCIRAHKGFENKPYSETYYGKRYGR